MAQNYGLGRGLASLIPQKKRTDQSDNNKIERPAKGFNYFGKTMDDAEVVVEGGLIKGENSGKNSIQEIATVLIVPNPHQPRLNFDEIKLQELSDSIKEHGIIQPIVVSRSGNQYEIIAGERRFQAAKLAGLSSVPVIVREVTEQEKLELAIIENIQRHDLNPVEEAKSYKSLLENFDLSQEEIAKKLGKSRSAVANKLRLLTLPIEIQKALMEGRITEGHAKAILALDNPEKQRALFELILKNSLTVRQTESKAGEISVKQHKRAINIDPEMKNLEDQLSQSLNTKVKLSKSGKGGKIIIEFYSSEELGSISDKIVGGKIS